MGRKKGDNNLKVITSDNDDYELLDDLGLFDNKNTKTSNYFLNYYSIDDIIELLNKVGILSTIRKRHHFYNLKIKIDINEYDQHSLYIHDDSIEDIPLVLLRMREVYFDAVKHFVSGIKLVNIPMLMIDWITLQNPKDSLSERYKHVPGQNYPGLGMIQKFYELITQMAKDLSVDALLAVPEYLHLAGIYSPVMKFYDPELQGKFESMIKDLRYNPKTPNKRKRLSEISSAIEDGKVINYMTDEVENWHPSEMIVSIGEGSDVYKYFKSPIYSKLKESYRESNRYRFSE